ncbi:hypothetical protein L6164_022252 [Bauhinia variegata]|uniref:Uncharacterized protein n=1 Tax=Bauhinia variegata TaxID=167791 RepID=A0ACB9MEF0_BAUVA|nr:hypothetical protein L6164_022252 [Bauhinia variegata]
MELIRRSYAVFFVILLCALTKGGSEGKRWKPEEFARDRGRLSSSLETEGKVEQVWAHCRKQLVDRKNDAEDFDMHRLERSDMGSALLLDKNIHSSTELVPPHMKQNLWNCKRKTTLSVPVSEEKEDSRELLTKHFGSTSESPTSRRRDLVAESPDDQMAPSPLKATPAPSPSSASSTQGPSSASSTEGPSNSPNMEAPAAKSGDRPPSSKSRSPSIPDDPPPSKSRPSIPDDPPPSKSRPPVPDDPPPPEPDRSLEKIIFIAAVSVALAGFLTLIVFLLCWPKVNSKREDPKVGRKDGSPPLMVPLSNFSAGSKKPIASENSDKKESGIDDGKIPSAVVSHVSIKAEDPNTSGPQNTSSEATGQESDHPLKLPAAESAPAPPKPPQQPQPPPVSAPRPPPPPAGSRVAQPPPAPPKPLGVKSHQPSPLRPLHKEQGGSSEGRESVAPKPKLKPFFWDKVNAKPGQEMVWDEILAGSFQFDEDMIESLFGATNLNKNERKKDSSSLEPSVQYIQIINPRKAQNLSILLRALNVTTEEMVDALKEGNEIPIELIQTLLKMAPTPEEELKLRMFTGELSQLGPAERFLKALVDIPFAFKRLESLMFMISLPEEVSSVKESFATLEVACEELKKSRLFLKLLEAVLKTGNRMNDGTYRGGAQAFKLDTLLKLSDVKGTDGKTTLLHFVVLEIIRSEGIRAVRTAKEGQSLSSVKTEDLEKDAFEESEEHYRSLGLQVVSGLSTELQDVRKAALIDGDILTASVSNLGHSLVKAKDFLKTDLKDLDEDSEFRVSLASFVEKTEADVMWLLEEEKRIMTLVKSTGDYFHGTAGKDGGLLLFVIVRDFLVILDKVCKEVKDTTMAAAATKANVPKKDTPSSTASPDTPQTDAPSSAASPDTRPTPSNMHRRLFPAIAERRVYDSSSDEDDDDG